MLKIGKYRMGAAAFSTAVLFIILSICAISSAICQARQEWSMPLAYIMVINESFALMVTLVYGIFAHLALVLIEKIRKRNKL